MLGIFKKKVDPTVELFSPCDGKIIPMEEVPDPTFSEGLLGPGFAVEPKTDEQTVQICAPVNGTVNKIFRAGHAFSMISEEGLELLVHIGLETVELKGEGFTKLVEEKTEVKAGTPIIEIKAAQIHEAGYRLVTPIVLTRILQVKNLELTNDSNSVVAIATLVQQ